MKLKIRTFKKQDWTAVSRIYNEGITSGIATFETEVPNWEIWNSKYIPECRLIAELHNDIVGFAVLSLVSKRDVYKGVAEVSIYVSKTKTNQGIGKRLLPKLIEESEKEGFWTLQAGIFPENINSIALHKTCGFRVIGTRERIAQLNDIWFDNVLLERRSKIIN